MKCSCARGEETLALRCCCTAGMRDKEFKGFCPRQKSLLCGVPHLPGLEETAGLLSQLESH